MDDIIYPEIGLYVVAVSGGVDSVVLLDLLSHQKGLDLVVVHVDHGIREDSGENADFVQRLAKARGFDFYSTTLKLGPHASEENARQKRYEYLLAVKEKVGAKAVITAHHADDVVETMVINILRGTGWRGLASLTSQPDIMRPLLLCRKEELLTYASEHHLDWYHDSTNDSTRYLRNYIRKNIAPRLNHEQWHDLYQQQCEIKHRIDDEVGRIRSCRRYDYIMWPPSVAIEILRSFLPVTRIQAVYALHAIKTAKIHKEIEVGSGYKIVLNRDDFIVINPVS